VARITIENLQTTVAARPGFSLLTTLLQEDQPIHTVCGGRARCGCCRIRVVAGGKGLSPINDGERTRLTSEQLASGWRLACQTQTLRDIAIYLPTTEELDGACGKKK
jgi:ferredoxin